MGTRGLPAPASRARLPHVLLAAAPNHTDCSGGGPGPPPRGASPLSLLPRRSRPAPRLAAPTPAARPGKLRRPLPPPPPGDGSRAPLPRPRGGQRHAPGSPAAGGRPGAAGGSRARASRLHPRPAGPMVRSDRALRSRRVRPSARPGRARRAGGEVGPRPRMPGRSRGVPRNPFRGASRGFPQAALARPSRGQQGKTPKL